ncbi:MAG: hypothetical protein ACRDB1_12240 [Microcoleaceae cyanobacterium]
MWYQLYCYSTDCTNCRKPFGARGDRLGQVLTNFSERSPWWDRNTYQAVYV